ncbi:helix-turn-helix domain-containing protein [Sphingomonas sp. Leaf357]|uniref:helix-turn-helix domain-containing protein n=1 Tax=Sphingomonas sp. Leaf357 TaxID=1736350 RepID=UPI000B1E9538|nr:helix-turn-helix transcriptional regulator [Sphingomonas sp. Leaf357]
MEHELPASPDVSSLRQRGRRRGPALTNASISDSAQSGLEVDLYRNVVFPNRIRELRIHQGFPKLYAFSEKLPSIPYIRLSKIERGEVFARAEELRLIAGALDSAPVDLLLDVEATDFKLEEWFVPFAEGALLDLTEEAEFALLLAAAIRARRAANDKLTAATMARDYGIPPVILSRLENAFKGLDRWNHQILENLCRLFGVDSETSLRSYVREQHISGELDRFLRDLPNAHSRHQRTRDRIAGLRRELDLPSPALPASPLAKRTLTRTSKLLPVFGSPLPDGLIAMTPTGLEIEGLAEAGSRSFGVRVGRATLGGGLPGNATVIVDPDRFPQPGGLALVRESNGYRVLSVAVGRDGAMIGYSVTPEREVALDGLAPEDMASVVAAVFI